MKIFSLVFLLMLFSQYVSAQVAEGNKFVNGTVTLFLVGNDLSDGVSSQITIAPRFGYFTSDRVAVGGSVGLVFSSFGDESNTSVSLSPFIRRYFPIVEDKFYFYLNGSLSLAYGSFTVGDVEVTTEEAFSLSLNASPGFSYFPSEQWSLDFSLSAFSLSFIDIGGEDGVTTTFLLGATTASPGLGFSYYF